jgi:hypothetical protein
MKKIAFAAVMLAASLSACDNAQAAPEVPSAPPAAADPQAIPAPAPPPEKIQIPAFPVAVRGPDGENLVVIQADGSITGNAPKLLDLLNAQKGGSPQDNILIALLMRALTEDAAKKPHHATLTSGIKKHS